MTWLERLKTIEQAPVIFQAPRPIDDLKQSKLVRFTNKGLSLDEAKEVAQRLDLRSQGDDRILCYECHHLKGYVGLWRCGNWRQAGIAIREAGAGLGDMVNSFQRCNGFNQLIKESEL
jgi:hypothetical protein